MDRMAFSTTEALRDRLLRERRSFVTETVFSDAAGAKLEYLARAQAAGYHVILVFIGVSSVQLSVARVVQRVEAGGHDVDDAKLVARFPRTLANLREAVRFVDEAFLFDNSSSSAPFRPVAVIRRGKRIRTFEPQPAWFRGLLP